MNSNFENIDEQNMLRLFRCATESDRHTIMQDLFIRLLKVNPIEGNYGFHDSQKLARVELELPMNERLFNVIPYINDLTDLHDYDYHFAEHAFEDSINNVLLGVSGDDEHNAQILAEAWLEGAMKHDVPLATEFGDTEEEMLQELRTKALAIIRAWRELIIGRIEKEKSS